MAAALATRGFARCRLGRQGWRKDCDEAGDGKHVDPLSQAIVVAFMYFTTIQSGRSGQTTAVREIEEARRWPSDSATTLPWNRTSDPWRCFGPPRHDRSVRGDDVLAGVANVPPTAVLPVGIAHGRSVHRMGARQTGDVDASIPVIRDAVDKMFEKDNCAWCIAASGILVETLLKRGTDRDVPEAEAAIERLRPRQWLTTSGT